MSQYQKYWNIDWFQLSTKIKNKHCYEWQQFYFSILINNKWWKIKQTLAFLCIVCFVNTADVFKNESKTNFRLWPKIKWNAHKVRGPVKITLLNGRHFWTRSQTRIFRLKSFKKTVRVWKMFFNEIKERKKVIFKGQKIDSLEMGKGRFKSYRNELIFIKGFEIKFLILVISF